MKKQKIACLSTLLWLCCVYSPTLQAQDKNPTPDSLTRYKWEIGTETNLDSKINLKKP